MADKKISELTTASEIKNDDNLELSQNTGSGLVSLKATILAIANKIVSNINFTSALQTNNKTITGAINEVAQGGGGGGSSTLDGLNDVDIDDTTLADGQALVYNGTSEKWENGQGGGGTTVVANPSGTATADLEKLQVGNDIYSIPSGGGGSGTNAEIIAIPVGNETNSRTFTFTKKPKFIHLFWIGPSGWNAHWDLVWGQTSCAYGYSAGTIPSGSGGFGVSGVSFDDVNLTMTLTGINPFGCANNSASGCNGLMFVTY